MRKAERSGCVKIKLNEETGEVTVVASETDRICEPKTAASGQTKAMTTGTKACLCWRIIGGKIYYWNC